MPIGVYLHKKGLHWKLKNLRKSESEENSNGWKGDNAGKKAMHRWVERQKGKPSFCEICGITSAKKYDWANIDHTYKRILDDYIRACRSCHQIYDKN